MSRTTRVVIWLIAAQAVAVLVYWLVERERDEVAALSTLPPEPAEGPVPHLSLRRRDGRTFELSSVERPTLLHFWATWCAPCRTELPALLALPDELPVDVIAVALDPEWSSVDAFLEESTPLTVLLGNAEQIETSLRIHTLPVTYLVAPDGRLRLRFDGARDWQDPEFRGTWLAATGTPN